MTANIAIKPWSYHILGFLQYLRQHGFLLGAGEMLAVFQGLHRIGLTSETKVRLTLQTICCSSAEEQSRFAQLFSEYFFGQWATKITGEQSSLSTGGVEDDLQNDSEDDPTSLSDRGDETTTGDKQVGESSQTAFDQQKNEWTFLERAQYSAETFQQKHVLKVPEDHVRMMYSLTHQFIHQYDWRRQRRMRPSQQGRRLDFRRTFRKNIETGAMIVPQWQGYTREEAGFLLFCDGSRSMLPYAEIFLQWAYALVKQAKRADVYLFSTNIRRITPLLMHHSLTRMPRLTHVSEEWGGGTRIGEALEAFVCEDGLQKVRKHSVIMIFSDGVDRGDMTSLQRALQWLSRKAGEIIWLNPLAVHKDYEAKTAGMQTAWPYIDCFTGVRDPDSYIHFVQRVKKGGVGNE